MTPQYLWLSDNDPCRKYGVTFVELPDPPKRQTKRKKKPKKKRS